MKILIPCCDTVCYEQNVPRYLTKYSGQTMINRVVKSLNSQQEIIIIAYDGLTFKNKSLRNLISENISICSFDYNELKFASQSETIYETIKRLNITDSIFIKDCDNTFDFEIVENDCGYICVESLNNLIRANVNNKSYVQTDHNQSIINLREKNVISDRFNVGGIYFTKAEEFRHYYEKLQSDLPWKNQLYVSDIVGAMILDGHRFEAKQTVNYKDYGTLEDYKINIIGD